MKYYRHSYSFKSEQGEGNGMIRSNFAKPTLSLMKAIAIELGKDGIEKVTITSIQRI